MKRFTDNELHQLYTTHVKLPPSYFTKYEILPPCPIKQWYNDWAAEWIDFPRNWTVLDFQEWIQKHGIHPTKMAYTCNRDPELELISCKEKVLLEYPAYDLHCISDTFKDEFDFFLFNQTLEHLYNPYKAVESIYTTLKSGGYVFTSVPTLNIPHGTPIHYGGYNPMGLAVMFKSAGFDIIEIGQWGNFDYIEKLWRTHDWVRFINLVKGGRITNEERNVCQCWILARKPYQ
jgi:SAM-dependent methyltransferase